MGRNQGKKYNWWRKKVFGRDGYKCVLCGDKHIEAHHIERWVDNKRLRFDPANGITLCIKHHTEVTGREELWAPQFKLMLLNRGTISNEAFFRVQNLLGRIEEGNKECE